MTAPAAREGGQQGEPSVSHGQTLNVCGQGCRMHDLVDKGKEK